MLLRLLDHLVETILLRRGQNRSEFSQRLIELLPDLRRIRLHDLPRPLLSLAQNPVHPLLLIRGKIQIPFNPAQKLDPHDTGRKPLARTRWCLGSLVILGNGLPKMAHQQAAGHYSGSVYHDRGQDDSPGLHRGASAEGEGNDTVPASTM